MAYNTAAEIRTLTNIPATTVDATIATFQERAVAVIVAFEETPNTESAKQVEVELVMAMYMNSLVLLNYKFSGFDLPRFQFVGLTNRQKAMLQSEDRYGAVAITGGEGD